VTGSTSDTSTTSYQDATDTHRMASERCPAVPGSTTSDSVQFGW
jgi:hypothetical protein